MSEPETDVGASPASPRGSRLWLIYMLSGIVVVGVYPFLPDLGRDALYFVVGLSTVVAIGVGVRMNRPKPALPWFLLIAGQVVWVAADLVYNTRRDIILVDPSPSPADVLYFLAYPLFTAALFVIVRHRRPRLDVGGVLDSLIVIAGLALLSVELLGRPALALEESSTASAVVAVGYPVGDLFLLAGAIRLVVTPGTWVRSARILLFAVLTLVAADTLESAYTLYAGDTPWWLDLLWLTSYVAWGVAALHPTMRVVTQPTTTLALRFSVGRFLALGAALFVPPGVLLWQQLTASEDDLYPAIIGSFLMYALVIGRMYLSIRQISAVNREREILQARLTYEATHDQLTGLPNRAQGLVLVEAALARGQRAGSSLAVLFLDLDGFKRVNDSMGHHAGDLVLERTAVRLQDGLRGGDVVCRFGGDEFVVVLEPVEDEAAARLVAERLVVAVGEPVDIPEHGQARVGVSVGIAMVMDGQLDADALVREADTAAYLAKSAGRGRVEVFDTRLRARLEAQAALEASLVDALGEGHITLTYCPIRSVATGRVDRCLAEAGWDLPDGERREGRDFAASIQSAEVAGRLGRFVLERAATDLAAWPEDELGASPRQVQVPVSAHYLRRPQFVDDVRATLSVSGLAPDRLCLRVSETDVVEDPRAMEKLRQLRGLGVEVDLDDFGRGYTSIGRLRDLPCTSVTLKQSFLDASPLPAHTVLALVVEGVHLLDVKATLDEVDTDEQLAVAASAGVDHVMGAAVGAPVAFPAAHRPMPAPRVVSERVG